MGGWRTGAAAERANQSMPPDLYFTCSLQENRDCLVATPMAWSAPWRKDWSPLTGVSATPGPSKPGCSKTEPPLRHPRFS
jgi:hypothetical protein